MYGICAMARRTSVLSVALVLVGLGIYYLWRPATSTFDFTSAAPVGLYGDLTQAFLSGRVSLLTPPDPHLLNLTNPYDPDKNLPWRRNDLSLFKGSYFIYHSPVPVITLFIPVKLLTGRYLSEDTAVGIFCLVGAAGGLCCLLALRRDYFPQSSPVSLLLCGSVLGLGCAQFSVLRDSSANHVAIACASCFLMLAFFSAIRSQRSSASTATWLVLTGLFQALAAVSRPNYIYGSFGVFFILIGLLRSNAGRRAGAQKAAVSAAALLIPMALVASLSGYYNFERFGNPFDFGASYMLGAWDQTHLATGDLSGARENAWYYFLSQGIYHRYFPFVTAPTWRAVGVIPHIPFLLLSPLLLLPAVRKPRAFTSYVAFVFIANTLSLIILPSGNEAAVLTSANSRYMLDFVPVMGLLACMAVLAASATLDRRVRAQWAFSAAVAFFALWSVLSNLSFDFQRVPSTSYRTLAQILDQPAALYERMRGQRYGAISIQTKFPSGLTGQTDPLVLTGRPGGNDLVYVTYTSPTTASFGLASDGVDGPLGAPVVVNYSKVHSIQVWMGSLYPPIGHPAVSRLSTAALIIAKRHVRVAIDGCLALDDVASSHDAIPTLVQVGENVGGIPFGSKAFRGEILSEDRLPLNEIKDALPVPAFGILDLMVRLPSGRIGVSEPLVVTGSPSAGDFVYVVYLAADRIQIGFDHWGHPGKLSKSINLDFTVPHNFEISMGSLYPKSKVEHGVRVTVDGQLVLTSDQDTYDSSPFEVSVGRNPIGGSSCVYAFTGKILELSRGLRE
jgi:hypothetical protein